MSDKYIVPLLPPGNWVPNDFKTGDRIVFRYGGPCTVISTNGMHYDGLKLKVEWDNESSQDAWPNMDWVGLLPADPDMEWVVEGDEQ